MRKDFRVSGLYLMTATAIAGMFLLSPRIPQDPLYHALADSRAFLGIPNFGNVFSNLPFTVVGIAGLGALWRGWFGIPRFSEADSLPYLCFFLGVALVGPGSAWYHLEPNNATLFWDRLPMTIAFMALVAAVLSERIGGGRGGRNGLYLLVGVGVASVFWWDTSETHGAGDLRAYALVQFWPVVLIPMVLWLFPEGRRVRARFLFAALLFYALAKAAEHYDEGIFSLTGGVVSGHTLKHLLAALGPLAILAMLRARPGPEEAFAEPGPAASPLKGPNAVRD